MLNLEDLFFHLRWEDVDAANNQHIVTAPAYAIHTTHRARGTGQKARQVAGTITNNRQRLFRQRGEQQFAMLTVGQWRTVIRIDHFREEMILPYCRTITRFDALHRHARPHHFREAINIQRRNTEATFDLRAHPRGPRLCAKYTGTQ